MVKVKMVKLALANLKPMLYFTKGSAMCENVVQHTDKMIPQKQFLIKIIGSVTTNAVFDNRFIKQRKKMTQNRLSEISVDLFIVRFVVW